MTASSAPALPETHFRSTEVDGLRIAYREAGPKDAPVILLLHGFPSSSHMFRDLIPALASEYHLIAPDYPGFGNSDAPSVDSFKYTFDHLADVAEGFVKKLGLTRFTMYVQDYGGPVGFRLATRHPEWIQAIVVQNANAYEEGISPMTRALLGPAWKQRTPATEAPILASMDLAGTRAQYTTGAKSPETMSPDGWTMDQFGLDRPGNRAIQLQLLATYDSNLSRYPEWHAYFAKHTPPMLITWGKGDPCFTVEGAKAYLRDLPDAELHLLDTGHFALEEEHAAIATYIRTFLRKNGT